MTDTHFERDKQLFKSLYFNRTGILLLAMTLASVAAIFLAVRVHDTAKEFWLGLSVAVLAASIYSCFQVLLTTKQFDNFLVDAIRRTTFEEISRVTETALQEYRSLQRSYVPIAAYPAVNAPGQRFNRDLNASIRESGHYTFYGVTARYAVARLALLAQVPGDVKFVMADPTRAAAVDARARRDVAVGDDEAFAQAKEELLRGIYLSIAGVFLTRRRFDRAEICFTRYPPIDRAELCDRSVYVARFSDNQEASVPFPSTMQFDRSSLIYQMFEHECNRLFASPYSEKVQVTPSTSEEEFLSRLDSAHIRITAEDWSRVKDGFRQFKDSLRLHLVP